MSEQEELVKLYTGDNITISRIKIELEAKGITSLVKDGFNQGLGAGFGGGVPSAIDIFVTEKDFEKAYGIVNVLTEE